MLLGGDRSQLALRGHIKRVFQTDLGKHFDKLTVQYKRVLENHLHFRLNDNIGKNRLSPATVWSTWRYLINMALLLFKRSWTA